MSYAWYILYGFVGCYPNIKISLRELKISFWTKIFVGTYQFRQKNEKKNLNNSNVLTREEKEKEA